MSRINVTKKNSGLEYGGKMTMVLCSFPLNLDNVENNGLANSHMWQMRNCNKETLSIRFKAML